MRLSKVFNRRVVLSLAALTIASVLLGEAAARARARNTVRLARARADERATLVARVLDDQFNALLTVTDLARAIPASRALLYRVAKQPEINSATDQARRTWLSSQADVARVSAVLEASTSRIGLIEAVYVMDTTGRIVASSDWQHAVSRLGRVHDDRDFVDRLHSENLVQKYAPSLTTRRPGVVFGMPVIDSARLMGSAVARADADAFSRLLDARQGALILVTDSAGVIVASSDQAQVLRRIDWSRRTPADSDRARPLATGLDAGAFPDSSVDLRAHRAWVTATIPLAGWTLHSVEHVTAADTVVQDTRLLAALLWLVASLGITFRARSREQMAEIAEAERVAKAEQQRVGELLNTSYDAVVTLNTQHRVVDWNTRAEVMFGYAAAEMVGTDPTERIIPAHARDRHRAGFAASIQTGRSDVFGKPRELTALNRKGTEFFIELTMSPARDSSGGLLFVAFFRDISDRKADEQARAAVAERVERYRSVVTDLAERDKQEWLPGLHDLITESTRAIGAERGSFWRLDEQLERMTCEIMLAGGREMLDGTALTLTREQSPGYFRALRRRQPIVAPNAATHEATREFAPGYLVPNNIGSVLDAPVWFEGREVGVLSFHHVGAPRDWEPETVEFASTIAGSVGLLMETVRRVESERALVVERERMERVLRRSPVSQAMWDIEAGLVFANPATVSLFGAESEATLVGTKPWQFSPPQQPDGTESRAAVEARIAKLPVEGQLTYETVLQRRDGTTFSAQITLVDLKDPERLRFVSIIVDLTEQNAARAAIVAAKEAAERAESAKSAFLATMSHEIRTPMNGVMSMAEMLENTELDEDQRGMLSVVRTSADSLLTIINDILDFSKIEAGKMELEEVEFDAARLVDDAAQLLAGRAQDKGIGLYSDLGADVPATVRGDPVRVRQVILNLAGNAVKFTENGHVCIRVTRTATDHLRFEAIDTGIGLTADEKSRLFQPFAQADSSTARRFGGTGLGLSICGRLVQLMGGTLGVNSVKDQGSTFWFELPLPAMSPPPRPEVAIDDLRVMLAGFPAEQSAILESYVRGAGAPAPTIVARATDAIGLFTADSHAADVVVFPTYPRDLPGGALQVVRQLRTLPGCDGVGVAMVVPATLISSASAAAQTGMVATTTAPVRRERFWRTLAVAVGRAQAEKRGRSAAAGVTTYTAPAKGVAAKAGALILVAEDNRTNQVVIARVLGQLGLAFEIVENGAIALRLLQSSRSQFGLLLTDFHMPEMDGFELTHRWREIEASGRVAGRLPILALTADALAGMGDRCREAGMDGYLTKPIDRAALTAELERWLPVAFTLRREVASVPRPSRARLESIDDAAAKAADAPSDAIDRVAFAQQLGVPEGPEADALLASLWESIESLPGKLAAALSTKNRTELREHAHGGKGEARAIGAFPLGTLCSDLQDLADSASWDALTALVGRVTAEHSRVAAAVRGLGSPAR